MCIWIYLMICWGITVILVKGSIFKGVRSWCEDSTRYARLKCVILDLISCYMCMGFWVGIAVCLVEGGLKLSRVWWISPFYGGCISAGACCFLGSGLDFLSEVDYFANRE